MSDSNDLPSSSSFTTSTLPSPSQCTCFQTLMQQWTEKSQLDGEGPPADVSEVFFELANAPWVSYRCGTDADGGDAVIRIQQDNAAQDHTGGIVWETAYLLLEYLLSPVVEGGEEEKEVSSKTKPPPNVLHSIMNRYHKRAKKREGTPYRTLLEMGAGCGMLGLSLCKNMALNLDGKSFRKEKDGTFQFIMTEVADVEKNLRQNCMANFGENMPSFIQSAVLDWTEYKEHCQRNKIQPGTVDMIVGTDVVFSTRFVEPMLETMEYLSHEDTYAIFCLQERCADAHALLLEKAKEHGFAIQDISEQVYDEYPVCAWGRDLDCKILVFTRTKGAKKTTQKKKKKRKGDRIKEEGKKSKRVNADSK